MVEEEGEKGGGENGERFVARGENGERFVPRVHQLDALALDREIFNSFKGSLQAAFKYFLR